MIKLTEGTYLFCNIRSQRKLFKIEYLSSRNQALSQCIYAASYTGDQMSPIKGIVTVVQSRDQIIISMVDGDFEAEIADLFEVYLHKLSEKTCLN